MTKEEKIILLTDNTKTDKEISEILGYAEGYLAILRYRLGISKKRGNKKGSIKNAQLSKCKVCDNIIKITKSHQRKYCSRKCQNECNEYKNKLKCADRSYMQSEAYSQSLSKPTTPSYKKYAGKVHRLSQKIYEEHKQMLNPEDFKRTLCGIDGGHQLDHIIPIRYGFDNNIPPENIARLENLRVIPWKENLTKGNKKT